MIYIGCCVRHGYGHRLIVIVVDKQDRAVAVEASVDVEMWREQFDTGFAWIAGRFGRAEPRLRARAFLLGLLSDVDSRSCWQLAVQAGDRSPHAMQRLLGDAVWDADSVRDDLRGYVADELGDPAGVLILDDTGVLKKGVHSVGVQRQYTGTAGRIENAQVAVFWPTPREGPDPGRPGRVPARVWTDDRDRCAAAGVPDDIGFTTKVALGRRMLARALDAGLPAAWATADEFYGGDRGLRRDLQGRTVGYVLAVAKSHRVDLPIGRLRADQAVARLPRRCWNRLSAGKGAKGERNYEWAWLRITPPVDEAAGHHWLLVRRNITDGVLPTTGAGHPARPRSPPSCTSPVPGGAWRNASKRPKAKSAWTSTRFGDGDPGTGTPPS